MSHLSDLLRERPLVQAPMAGGASTPELVAAVARAGGLGFLAAGYLAPERVEEQVALVRGRGVTAFGVNVFVPGPAGDPAAVRDYRGELDAEAERYGTAPGAPVHDDDAWDAKIDLLERLEVPVVGFTFGCPDGNVLRRLQEAGAAVVVTVTSVDEALLAVARGADGLCAQGVEAGGHRAAFDPTLGGELPTVELVAALAEAVEVPVIGAGGIMTGGEAAAVLGAGAAAVQLGTAFLRCPESGAQPAHKLALTDPGFTETTLTWAFTGRPARGLVNRFVTEHPKAPYAYPELHHMTRPLRAAAARAADTGGMALWAGTGFRSATDDPAAEVVERLRREAAQAGARL
ncbi:nitronate monooxygenase [Nocardiopsis sp. CC223A]|uniref:nitronate monooxygenase n=1 Tax=Nocardiopsis sp. CC223A TaxID=3044051 RepID=UPI00278BCEA4|nr:nitronate monooxygenase [Nocardiopsis sp. CC223A]